MTAGTETAGNGTGGRGPDLCRATPWWPFAAATVVAVLFHGIYYNVGLKNLIDLGVLAVDSERILDGQRFGRDFIAPYGPGRYYLTAVLFGIFGHSVAVLCGLFLVLRVMVDVGTLWLARQVLPWGPALMVTLCTACAHGPTHKGFLTAGLVLIGLAAVRAVSLPTGKRIFLLGCAAGLAAAFRYDLGVVGLVLGAIAVAAGPIGHRGTPEQPSFVRGGLAFLAGAFLLFLPSGLLILTGDPARLLACELSRASLLQEAQAAAPGVLSALFSGSQPAGALLSLLLLASCPLVLLLSLVDLKADSFSEGRKIRLAAVALAVSGLLLFTQYAIEPKINRLLQVGPPLFICLILLFHRLGVRCLPRGISWIAPAAVLCVTGWYVLAESGKGSLDSPAVLLREQVPVEGDRAGFHAGPNLAESLAAVPAWVEQHITRGTFYASPSLPLYYFLSGRPNPAPVTDFTYLLRNREVQEWVLRSIDEGEVDYYLYKPAVIQGFDPEKEGPHLFSQLRVMYPRYVSLPGGCRMFMKP